MWPARLTSASPAAIPARGRGTLRIDVSHGDAFLRSAPHRQHAQQRRLIGVELGGEFDFGGDPLRAAEGDDGHLVAGVTAAEFFLQLGQPGDLPPADLHDPVAGAEPGLRRRRLARQAAIVASPRRSSPGRRLTPASPV